MLIDWENLAIEVGSRGKSGETGGTVLAQQALERILGDQNILAAVETVADGKPGAMLARSVLGYLSSLKALDAAYRTYESSGGARASLALSLIVEIAHPRALEWIPALLQSGDTAGWGIDILDQLLFRRRIDYMDERVEPILAMADKHANPNVREKAFGIRRDIERRRSRLDDRQ